MRLFLVYISQIIESTYKSTKLNFQRTNPMLKGYKLVWLIRLYREESKFKGRKVKV